MQFLCCEDRGKLGIENINNDQHKFGDFWTSETIKIKSKKKSN
jgi:hypothetical protein